MYAMTAAHPTLPLPSYARISNPGQRPRGRRAHQRPRPVPCRPHRRPQLRRGAQARPAARRRAGRARAAHLRRDPRRHLAPRRRVDATRLASATPPRGPRCRTPPPRRAPRRCRSPSPPSCRWPRHRPRAPRARGAGPPCRGVDHADAFGRDRAAAARGFWVQLGAFREARRRRELSAPRRRRGRSWLAPLLATFGDAALYRVQAGPYPSRDDAQGAAPRVRDALGAGAGGRRAPLRRCAADAGAAQRPPVTSTIEPVV